MKFLSRLTAPFQNAMRKTVDSFITLETTDDKYTVVSRDGSLITYVKIEGSRQIIGEEEFKNLIEASTLKIGSRFDRRGHALQVYFVRDPGRIGSHLKKQIRPSRVTAENTQMELEDVFSERISHLSHFLSYEECFYVLWTRPSILTKNELARVKDDIKNTEWVMAPDAQNPTAAIDTLRTRHKSYVASIMSALDELSIKAVKLEVHDALRAVRDNLFPDKANEKWRPCLPGDPIPTRSQSSVRDMSEILWPSLPQQLTVADAKVLNESIVRIGNLLWAGGDITLAPMEPSPFPMLLNRLFEANVPYRISFIIEGGGASSSALRSSVATLLGVTNAVNKQIKYALEGLEVMARSEPVVKMRVSFATWSKRDEGRKLKERLSVLVQAIESWGYCQTDEVTGDPLDCVMSSAMGIHCAGTAPTAIAPMYEVMKLLPWQRPSSPFTQGSIMLRTPDGKLWPYQTGSAMTTTWFDLIFAQPGAGKSVLMNTLNLGTVLTPGMSKTPFVAVIDIGPSSSGLISLVKEALPPERKYEAGYFRLQMSPEYAVNPFDTQLGCRSPLPDERSYLVELLVLLCTPPGSDKPYDGIQQLCGMVVDEIYRWRDDAQANAEARPYLQRIDQDVDEALRKHNIKLPDDPYWWDVVDKLFEAGDYQHAVLAQRHAVPILSDTITAARRPQIQSILEETSIGSSTENVVSAFERMITSAVREYPILSSVTKFEITNARVCSLDLMDVAPQGDETADRQTSIMYMLARHVLVRNWWMDEDSLKNVPQKYRSYHEARLRDYIETPKRLCYDEFHRTSSSSSVRGQILRDVREGRKRGVQIVLASQLLDDFDGDMIDIATGVWILGAAISDKAVDEIQNRFGLSQSARNVLRFKLTGPKSSGAPALFILATKEGKYEQHVINTLGPIEIWALTTSSEDVAIRNRLYRKIGASRARQMLAANFPGGSARAEIKRRVLMRSEQEGGSRNAAVGAVIEEIVNELSEASITSLNKTPEGEDVEA